MDSIETYRGEAIASMAKTVDALEHQVTRSRSYLARTRPEGTR
jgi:hypothetical protein